MFFLKKLSLRLSAEQYVGWTTGWAVQRAGHLGQGSTLSWAFYFSPATRWRRSCGTLPCQCLMNTKRAACCTWQPAAWNPLPRRVYYAPRALSSLNPRRQLLSLPERRPRWPCPSPLLHLVTLSRFSPTKGAEHPAGFY